MKRHSFALEKPVRKRVKEQHPKRESKLEKPFRKELLTKTIKVYKGGSKWCRTLKSAALNEARAILISQCNCDGRYAWQDGGRYACRYHNMNVDEYKNIRGRIMSILLMHWRRNITTITGTTK